MTGETDDQVGRWEYFETAPGSETVIKEIRKADLQATEAVRLQDLLERVAAGDHLPGDVKKLRGAIWEVRLSGEGRIFRLLYSTVGAGPLLLGLTFHGKKTRKTPPQTIMKAEKRLKAWRRQL